MAVTANCSAASSPANYTLLQPGQPQYLYFNPFGISPGSSPGRVQSLFFITLKTDPQQGKKGVFIMFTGCYELRPTSSQKSFYGKALVLTFSDGSKVLQSYSTWVAKITPNGDVVRLWCGWSATTGKHIASFCGLNKREFLALPLN